MTTEYHGTPTESPSHQDKHKAPAPPHIRPLSLQDVRDASVPTSRITAFDWKSSAGRLGRRRRHRHDSPIRSSKFSRTGVEHAINITYAIMITHRARGPCTPMVRVR